MGPYVLTAPGLVQMQDAQTTGNGNILLLRGACSRLTVYIQGNGTISAGAITIEEAYYDPNGPVYAGTWSTIGSAVTITSAQTAVHAVGSFWAVRCRISTTVTGSGGSVSVWAWGN